MEMARVIKQLADLVRPAEQPRIDGRVDEPPQLVAAPPASARRPPLANLVVAAACGREAMRQPFINVATRATSAQELGIDGIGSEHTCFATI
jgi:hypothetical protein